MGNDRMDIALHYTERGRGKPLILLHGNGEDGGYFANQMEYFSGRRRVIAIDTRGHGKSPRGSAPFTIAQFARDFYGFMEAHSIDQADLLGFSDGGNIALVFALNHPERVSHLILNGANLFGGGVKAHVQIPIIIGYHLASTFAKKSPEAERHAELLGLMVHDPNLRPEQLESLAVRTLLITGTRDMIKDSHTQLMLEHLPNAEWKRISGNHFIASRNPDAFNRAVDAFLQT